MRIEWLVLAWSAFAFAADLGPGAYTSGPESTLSLKARADRDWDIDGTSANEKAQVCELRGRLPKSGGRLRFTDPKETCQLRIAASARGFEVTYENESCRALCPDALSFEGTYEASKPECDRARVSRRRSEGRKQFDRKNFPEARRIFAELDQKCGSLLNNTDRGWLVNDLALALHKLGDGEGCRKALAPVQPLVDTYEANQGFDGLGYDEALRKSYEKIVKATRVNLKLCAAK